MSALVPKKQTFQFGLLVFLVFGLSAGIILVSQRQSLANPKASNLMLSTPHPSPTPTPKLLPRHK